MFKTEKMWKKNPKTKPKRPEALTLCPPPDSAPDPRHTTWTALLYWPFQTPAEHFSGTLHRNIKYNITLFRTKPRMIQTVFTVAVTEPRPDSHSSIHHSNSPRPFTLIMWQLTTNGRALWTWAGGACSYGWCNRNHSRGWNRSGFPVHTGANWLICDNNTMFSMSFCSTFPYHICDWKNAGLLNLAQRQLLSCEM